MRARRQVARAACPPLHAVATSTPPSADPRCGRRRGGCCDPRGARSAGRGSPCRWSRPSRAVRASSSITDSPLFESRLPVGSSASRITGSPGDRAGHGDALLLSAGQLAGQMLGAMRHADPLERVAARAVALGGAHAAVGQRQLDILEHRQVANQIEALEDEPDLAVPDPRALGLRQRRRPAGRSGDSRRRSACRAVRGSTAASICRSPTAPQSRHTRRARSASSTSAARASRPRR